MGLWPLPAGPSAAEFIWKSAGSTEQSMHVALVCICFPELWNWHQPGCMGGEGSIEEVFQDPALLQSAGLCVKMEITWAMRHLWPLEGKWASAKGVFSTRWTWEWHLWKSFLQALSVINSLLSAPLLVQLPEDLPKDSLLLTSFLACAGCSQRSKTYRSSWVHLLALVFSHLRVMYSFVEAHMDLFLPRLLLWNCSSAEEWDFSIASCFPLCFLGAGTAVMQDLLGSSAFFWDALYGTAEQFLLAAYISRRITYA